MTTVVITVSPHISPTIITGRYGVKVADVDLSSATPASSILSHTCYRVLRVYIVIFVVTCHSSVFRMCQIGNMVIRTEFDASRTSTVHESLIGETCMA